MPMFSTLARGFFQPTATALAQRRAALRGAVAVWPMRCQILETWSMIDTSYPRLLQLYGNHCMLKWPNCILPVPLTRFKNPIVQFPVKQGHHLQIFLGILVLCTRNCNSEEIRTLSSGAPTKTWKN